MDIKKTPLAVAVFMEIVYVVCLLFVWLFPGFSKTLFQSWMHGVDLTTVWNPSVFLSASSIALGLVTVFLITYGLMWFFIVLYKAIVK